MHERSSVQGAVARENPPRFIRFFHEIGIADVPLVGGKNASLGEMFQELTAKGISVPNGFAITAEAYRHALETAGAWSALKQTLDGLDASDVDDLARRAARARDVVHSAGLPPDLEAEIRAALALLAQEYGPEVSVAIRSSATAEDLPTASFAGQHDSYLNVRGGNAVLDAVRRCFASLFTDRAIRYRIDNGFDHFKVFNSVGVMKMVRSICLVRRHLHHRHRDRLRGRRVHHRGSRPWRERRAGCRRSGRILCLQADLSPGKKGGP